MSPYVVGCHQRGRRLNGQGKHLKEQDFLPVRIVSKVKLHLLYCHPPQLRPTTPGL